VSELPPERLFRLVLRASVPQVATGEVVPRETIDAAHRVMRHESKCATLHGHRYKVEITCEADELDSVGRVVDFGVIKARVGAWLDTHWDHTTIVNSEDTSLVAWTTNEASNLGKRPPFVFDGEPTAENMARFLVSLAQGLIGRAGLRVVKVRVWETPNCYADAAPQALRVPSPSDTVDGGNHGP